MNRLFISSRDLDMISGALAREEKNRGTACYSYTASCSWDCKRWDCAISCDCANCRD